MIRTDFHETSHLFLSYPKKFYNEYEMLVPFYEGLIEMIPNEVHQFIITSTSEIGDELKIKFSHKNLDCIVVKNWDEIWLRDCMGMVTDSHIIKPIYYPNYCSLKRYWNYFKGINKLSRDIIQESLSMTITDLPLILDGGNFVNNYSIAFLTNKVIEDNPDKRVLELIKDTCDLTPIIVEKNYYDSIGHIDGYLAFKDETSIFISEYPKLKLLNKDIQYVESLKNVALENGFKIIPIYDRPLDEIANCGCKGNCGCFYSAKGTYINFIRLNNYIILPEYSIPIRKQDKDYNNINERVLTENGFIVLKINCDDVAQFGGSLHCLSWQA